MDDKDALTDIELAWLIGIDALMVQLGPQAHAAAAARMVELWNKGCPAFHTQLQMRAGAWRQRQNHLQRLMVEEKGPCMRLVQILDCGGGKNPQEQAPEHRRKHRKIVKPSYRQYTPVRKMSDEEVKKFMDLLDAEGISVLFDPGVSFSTSGELHKPPLIRLDGHAIDYEQIAPVYERGEIERVWDPIEREPAIAVAFDLALLVILREKKWTWVVCDRHFARLPWGHPCKLTPEGRPGWKLVTGLLEGAGLIERRRGRTWRLVKREGSNAASTIQRWWLSAAGTH